MNGQDFEELIKAWFSGTKTATEIILETKNTLHIQKHIDKGYGFDYAYSLALGEYDEQYEHLVSFFLSDNTVTHLSIDGLTHNFQMLKRGVINTEQFLEWCSWSVIGGANTTLHIENDCIEYLCSIFILKNQNLLTSEEAIDSLIRLVQASNSIPYEKFIFYIYLLVEKERKSLYYFFKSYLESKKTDAELNDYLIKKFNLNIKKFNYNLNRFPYKKELADLKKNNATIEDLFLILAFKET